MERKIGMVSLGCPKNQIDAEHILADLKGKGYIIASQAADCDVVIINTCGFIDAAKAEAIENILEFAQLKEEGRIKGVVVTGCLSERYRQQILEEIPEVDAVVGIGANQSIPDIVEQVLEGKTHLEQYGEKTSLSLEGERLLSTPPYTAYLKIAEGCSNHCTYCAIPSIRGHFRSRPMENIVEEAKTLAAQGVKELILVAQDTTNYGSDLYGRYALTDLLKQLFEIKEFSWIRLLYCYPDKITDELLELMKGDNPLLPYLDLPLQHCADGVLKRMHRPMLGEETKQLLAHIRQTVPNITLRTTLIAGFPGETEQEFEQLCRFVKEMKFDRLGCFAYSQEEGTPAAKLPEQLEEEVKQRRAELVMEYQGRIMDRLSKRKIGSTIPVMLEGYDRMNRCCYGRSEADAPDIDCKVFFQAQGHHHTGEIIQVEITDTMDGDLLGREAGLPKRGKQG